MTTEQRQYVRDVIQKRPTTKRNAETIELAIFECVDEDEYTEFAYTMIAWIREPESNLKDILAHLKNKKSVWNMPTYSRMLIEEDLENDRKTRPTKIVDGIYKCKKCACRKIATYSVQTRGGDEAMTHFFTCTQCGKKWNTG